MLKMQVFSANIKQRNFIVSQGNKNTVTLNLQKLIKKMRRLVPPYLKGII